MKSKSDRRIPKFPPMPTVGHVQQTDPLVWLPEHHGLPCFFTKPTQSVKPFYSARAVTQAQALNLELPERVDLNKATIKSIRLRANPWHPSGRVDRIVYVLPHATLTLKFNGDGEQIECVDVTRVITGIAPQAVVGKYTGPRAPGDKTVSVNAKRR